MEIIEEQPRPQVLISILNWNNAELTLRCLTSLEAAGYLSSEDVEVLVIDNGSRPGDADVMARYCEQKQVRFRANAENRGFAGGHNDALQEALKRSVPFIWILNNDTLVPSNALEALLSTMKAHEDCACAAPCLAFEDTERIYFAGSKHDWAALEADWCPTPWDESFHSTESLDIWSVGTATLLRSAALQQVGLLNDALFAYYDDDDIGARFRQSGWRTVILKSVVVKHGPEPVGENERPPYFYYLMTRNRAVFYLQFTPRPYRRLIHVRLYARAAANAARLKAAGRADLADATLLGIQDALSGRLGPPVLNRRVNVTTRLLAKLVNIANFMQRSVS
jgi:GT2 family glycosyltransferase